MDLRLEAAAISEMADNIKTDENFRVPVVDWRRTSKRVLTLEWIDGTPIADHAGLRARGFDMAHLGLTVMRTFLRHAMRDGFFHADMHQGNLFVDSSCRQFYSKNYCARAAADYTANKNRDFARR